MDAELLLVIDELGKAELVKDGKTKWSSDNDPDVAERLGIDFFTDKDAESVADYLQEIGMLTAREKQRTLEIESPDDDDEEEEEEEDEDEDAELET